MVAEIWASVISSFLDQLVALNCNIHSPDVSVTKDHLSYAATWPLQRTWLHKTGSAVQLCET